ncbi:MAG: helix-turn-helix transcriptional regulator [Bacillota bacterium]|nr:helix-turn-helix transcriptional regulator [Bacillota bacterium]
MQGHFIQRLEVLFVTISQRLFEIMKEKKLSDADLARGTGISANTIGDWRRKGTNPSADKIPCICNFLDISTDFLLMGKERAPQIPESMNELFEVYETLDKAGRAIVLAKAYEEQRSKLKRLSKVNEAEIAEEIMELASQNAAELSKSKHHG